MICQNCGGKATSRGTAQSAIQEQYNFTDQEFEDDKVIVRVWHPDCALADHRIDNKGELDDGLDFYWEARLA